MSRLKKEVPGQLCSESMITRPLKYYCSLCRLEHLRALQTARLDKESAQDRDSRSAVYSESTLT